VPEPPADGGAPSSGKPPATKTDAMVRSLTDASDAALVVSIGRWHDDAMAEVFRRHGGAVFALAKRVLGGDTGRAEEIVQEVFVRLWNQPERFDPERGSLRSFLLAQAHGRSVDVLRSDSARKGREERDVRATAEGGYDLEREVWDMAVAEQVREAVMRLPSEERRPIELAYFGGRTYREVAAELGAPEGTVKSRIRSGLKRMRAGLAETSVGAAWAE
jgi:RNA polymerase sigma-70 factor (ECF subfamily)